MLYVIELEVYDEHNSCLNATHLMNTIDHLVPSHHFKLSQLAEAQLHPISRIKGNYHWEDINSKEFVSFD